MQTFDAFDSLPRLLLAAVFIASCGNSTGSSNSDAAADSGRPVSDATFTTPAGYVAIQVPNPDGPCSLPTACGGDVTGSWVLVSECNRYPDPSGPDTASCDAAGDAIVAFTGMERKTMVFAGGSVSGTNDRIEDWAFVWPASCMGSTPCSAWGALLASSIDAYTLTASCNADSSGTCTCTEIEPDPVFSGSWGPATYQISGTDLNLTSPSNSETLSYCVSGSQLTYFNPDGDWVYTYQRQ